MHVLNKTKIRNIPEYSSPFHIWYEHCMFYVIGCIFDVKCLKFYVLHMLLHVSCHCFTFEVKCCMSWKNKKKISKYSCSFHVWRQHCMLYVIGCIFDMKCCRFYVLCQLLHVWCQCFMFIVKCCMSCIKPNNKEYF